MKLANHLAGLAAVSVIALASEPISIRFDKVLAGAKFQREQLPPVLMGVVDVQKYESQGDYKIDEDTVFDLEMPDLNISQPQILMSLHFDNELPVQQTISVPEESSGTKDQPGSVEIHLGKYFTNEELVYKKKMNIQFLIVGRDGDATKKYFKARIDAQKQTNRFAGL